MQILIVEDEEQIANPLMKNFLEEGHNALIAKDGFEALKFISEIEFDLIVLDWRMPKMSGLEVCKILRNENNKTPIILLTALNDISHKVEALNFGADDYITKPFSFEELLARIFAVLRRYNSVSNSISFENITLDLITRVLTTPAGEIKLTEKEFELLRYFIQNKGSILSKDNISENVWNQEYSSYTNVIEATVKNLRRKLEESTSKNYIKAIYGEGYIFIAD